MNDDGQGATIDTSAPGTDVTKSANVVEPAGAAVNEDKKINMLADASDGETVNLLADAGAPGSDGDAKADADPEGAPEEYAEFTLPEGRELDPNALSQFKTLAKELNLTQAAAQKIVDFDVAREQANLALVDAAAQAYLKQPGAKAELALAAKGRDYIAGKVEGFGEIFGDRRVGNNPIIVKAFSEIGKMLAEDSLVEGGQARKADVRVEDRLFGHLFNGKN